MDTDDIGIVNKLASHYNHVFIWWGYHSGSPTAVQAWQPCPLWEPSPSHSIL